MPRVATKPMSGSASNAANAAVKEKFPNTVSPGDKNYPAFQRAWMDAYIANGGKYKIEEAEPKPEKQEEWQGFPYVMPKSASNEALYAPDFTQSPEKSLVEECPASEYPSPYPEDYAEAPMGPFAPEPCIIEEKPCCITALTAGCGHSSRSFVLKPPTTKTNPAHDQVIQLLGEIKGQDDLVLKLSAVSPCPKGGKPVVKFDGHDYSGSTHKFTLQAPVSDQIGGVMDFIPFVKTFLLMKSGETSRTYKGGASCIEGGEEFNFTAEIFPQKTWSIELSMSCEMPDDRNVVGLSTYNSKNEIIGEKERAVYSYDPNESFLKFSGKIEGSYAGKKTEVQLFSYEKANTNNIATKKIFPKLEQFFEKLLPKLAEFLSSPLIEITPRWPAVVLKGGAELMEIPDKYNVARKGDLSLELSPLLGLEGKADLLNWLIAWASGPFAKMLLKAKKKAEEGFGNDYIGASIKCSIDLTVGGQVGGGFAWEFIPQGKDTGAGKVNGSVDFTVKGEVSGEIRVFMVGYKAGAYLQAKTGFGGEMSGTFYGDEPGFSGKLIFDGLIIKAVAFVGATGTKDETHRDVKVSRRGRRRGRFNREEMGVTDEDILYECEILPPGEWPQSDATTVTDGEGL
ncbi:hypothetical protein N9M10_04995 [Hellea sp.]|nr:hypothetical protein [Hellea sp.]